MDYVFMKLYKSIAYIISFWNLITSTILFTLGVLSPIIFADLLQIMRNSQPDGYSLMLDIIIAAIGLGLSGIILSIIVIISLRKISISGKKLYTILILAAFGFIILHALSINFMNDVFYDTVVGDYLISKWTSYDYEYMDRTTQLNDSFWWGLLPGLFLMASGVLAYRESKKLSSNKI